MSESNSVSGGGYTAIPGGINMASGTAPIGELTVDQLWSGLCLWARGDARFFRGFATMEVLSDDGRDIVKVIKSQIAGRQVTQRSTIREGHVITFDNLDGPWFMVIIVIDTSETEAPALAITTLRHTLHSEYEAPEAAAARGIPPPPKPQQVVEHILGIVRELAAAGDL